MGSEVTQVVHLNEVEVVLSLDKICPLIYPLTPLFIRKPATFGGRVAGRRFSMLVRHMFSQFSVLTICLGTSSLRGSELEKDVFRLVK
jgi:hypothetical protein